MTAAGVDDEVDILAGMRNGAWLDAQVFPPLEYVVPALITEGAGILIGPPKLGKSWLVANFGLACAAGGSALGRIRVTPRPVLYLALEDGERRLQSRFRTITCGEPIPGIDYQHPRAGLIHQTNNTAAPEESRGGPTTTATPMDVLSSLGLN